MTVPAVETKSLTMAGAIHEALDEALAKDSRVFLLGEDIADPSALGPKTEGLSAKHGRNRVLNTPISEAAIIGAAIGAALDGQIPVADIMIADFMTIPMDQIVNVAAKSRFTTSGRTPCPITIRTSIIGGGVGATHSQSLEGLFMHIPGLKVIVPSTPADAKGLLTAAIFDPDPCIFFETNRISGIPGDVPIGDHVLEIGKADIKRAGTDVTLIAYGRAVLDALQAADRLASQGVDAEVLDLRSLMPLDTRTILSSVARTGRAVITHYATQFAGPGAELAALIGADLFGELKAPVLRVGSRYRPIPAHTLESAVYPSPERIIEAVNQSMSFSR